MTSTAAERFFNERQITPPSIDALIKAAKASTIAKSVARWAGAERLPGRPKDRLRFYYRGQADSRWGLSSTLYRSIPHGGTVTERRLANAEAAVLKAMRDQGLGRRMTDGELLMVLQHHAIPTRLIDFTRTFWPALYFATHELDGVDGRVFMIGQRIGEDDNGERTHPRIFLEREKRLPWRHAAVGSKYADLSWSNTVACVDDAALDPRMRAQNGCFLVGGLIRRYRGEAMTIGGVNQPAAVWPDITTLRAFFPMPAARKPLSDRWPAVGWTLRIPAEWKAELREQLAERSYTHDHMYPDFDGCRRLGRYIAAQTT